MTTSLDGKVVLITGASSGFGEDAALQFAASGCKVVLAARRMERLEALAEKIRADGGEALPVPVDVTDRVQIERMVQAALEAYGHIDILFNNAGFGRLDWFENLDPDRDIETQVKVNLLGVIQTTRAVIPHMLARRSGHIINMSSVAGLIPAPLYSIYAPTKFAVRAFTDVLRREMAPFGIRVTGIYPGPAATEFGQHTGSKHSAGGFIKRLGILYMTSEYVARRVVQAAERAPRSVVIPWWFRVLSAFNALLPGVTDWFITTVFTRRYHKLEEK